jgi:hypothetical protein
MQHYVGPRIDRMTMFAGCVAEKARIGRDLFYRSEDDPPAMRRISSGRDSGAHWPPA